MARCKKTDMLISEIKKAGGGKVSKATSSASAYPIHIDLEKAKRDTAARDRARSQSRPAPPITQRDLDRYMRMQGEESGELRLYGAGFKKDGSPINKTDGGKVRSAPPMPSLRAKARSQSRSPIPTGPIDVYAPAGNSLASKAAERARKLAAAKANRGSESSRGIDLRQEAAAVRRTGRNVLGRVLRLGNAEINVLGGTALTVAGLLGSAVGSKDGPGDLERGRGAFKDVGKDVKAIIMGEPPGEDVVTNRVYRRGSDKDWRSNENKPKGAMRMGGKASLKAVDGNKNPGLEKLPSEVRNKMGYMKKGGNPKTRGLAVMISIGLPMKGMKKPKDDMKKPTKKMGGGMMYADGGEMMKPIKRAAGGAAKVRKGMMTSEGDIIHAMNKINGK